jgi:hypothetical protein
VAGAAYPADLAEAALHIFLAWFGPHYARSASVESFDSDGATAAGVVLVGRRWRLNVFVANTLAPEANFQWESERAAIEKRLDAEPEPVALWVPRGARPPSAEPGLSDMVVAVEEAQRLEDGRRELRRPVTLYLRRTGTTGSVITVLGGLSAHWAQFTNRVPGSYQLNSMELHRLPAAQDEREALAERIVHAAGQPLADESQEIPADDAWTVTPLTGWRSAVIGTPLPEDDQQAATLRRNLRNQLRALRERPRDGDAGALVVLGAATYAAEEKLSWAIRGMDPTLHAGYDLLAVIADGVVKTLLQPGRGSLPWDAPLG